LKVLHLSYGGQMVEMCHALREVGINATSCHFREKTFKFKPDICLHLNQYLDEDKDKKREEFFQQAVKEFDVFHFHYGETFFPDGRDLPLLKKMGKKVVIQHRGSDVRVLSIARKFNNPYVRIKSGKSRSKSAIVTKLKQLSSYIDHAIVADHELYPYVKKYYKNVHIIRQAVNLKKFVPDYPSPKQNKPLIIHAPTNTNVKGTEYVLQAIKRLERKGLSFEFKLIEKMKHEEALKLYRRADIVIDQLLIGSFGIFSLEAMAFGKPVVCYIRDGLTEKYPGKLPLVNANPETLYDILKNLVKNQQRRHKYGVKGRRYVEENYDSIMVAKQLATLYRSL
jgi:glycosyltransferase involved in cell wall biosynthesis